MDQRTRMWKTLGYLVAAMSGTVAMLDWMDPVRPPLVAQIPLDEVLQLAHRAVTSDVVIRRDRWADVDVVPARTIQGRMLAATSAGPAWHFLVDTDGHPAPGGRWRAQEAVADAPGTVRILVAGAGGDLPMTAQQLTCVRALVMALSDVAGSGKTSLPVHLDESFAEFYGPPLLTDRHALRVGQTSG